MEISITFTCCWLEPEAENIYQFVNEDEDLSLGMFGGLAVSIDGNSPSLVSNDFYVTIEAVDGGSELWP